MAKRHQIIAILMMIGSRRAPRKSLWANDLQSRYGPQKHFFSSFIIMDNATIPFRA